MWHAEESAPDRIPQLGSTKLKHIIPKRLPCTISYSTPACFYCLIASPLWQNCRFFFGCCIFVTRWKHALLTRHTMQALLSTMHKALSNESLFLRPLSGHELWNEHPASIGVYNTCNTENKKTCVALAWYYTETGMAGCDGAWPKGHDINNIACSLFISQLNKIKLCVACLHCLCGRARPTCDWMFTFTSPV